MEELFNNITDTSVTLLEKENVTELAKSAVIDKSVSIFYFVVKTLKFLNLYYLGAVIVVGVLGNSFNFVSFVRTRNKLRSPSYYLAALALADFVFLAVLFIIWLNQLKINLFEWPIIYEILVYLSAFSSSMSAWLVVAFTFERLIVIRYPLKRFKLCTVRRAKRIIGCISVAIAVLQILHLFATDSTNRTMGDDQGTNHTATSSNSTETNNNKDFNWIDLLPDYYQIMRFLIMVETATTIAIPPALTVVMNIFIINGLYQYNKTFKPHLDQQQQTSDTTELQAPAIDEAVNIQMKPIGRRTTLEATSHSEVESHNEPISSSNHVDKCINALAVIEDHQKSSSWMPSESGATSLTTPHRCTSFTNLIGREKRNKELETSDDNINRMDVHSGLQQETPLNMDAIQSDPSQSSPTGIGTINLDQVETATQADHGNRFVSGLHPNSPSSSNRNYSRELNRHNASSSIPSEYTITKKLVLISTLHILLNLPSYAMELKVFIDEAVYNVEISPRTRILQDYAMLLYYTNFAINFLLYSSSNIKFNYNCFTWCKNRIKNKPQLQLV